MEIRKNIDDAFRGLVLDEASHTYTLGDKKLKGSVSGLIKSFYLPFPEEEAVKRTMAKTGRSKEDILKEWKEINEESTDRGSRVHLFGERYPLNKTLVPSCPQERAVKKFWDELPKHIILVGLEIKMYHKSYMFPGTMDLLLYDTINNHYIIADYKTNKDLHKNFQGQRMLPPFNHLLDCPLNHYQVQLSFYQILLEQLGIIVKERKVIYLTLEGEYVMWDTKDYTPQLKNFLKIKYEDC